MDFSRIRRPTCLAAWPSERWQERRTRIRYWSIDDFCFWLCCIGHLCFRWRSPVAKLLEFQTRETCLVQTPAVGPLAGKMQKVHFSHPLSIVSFHDLNLSETLTFIGFIRSQSLESLSCWGNCCDRTACAQSEKGQGRGQVGVFWGFFCRKGAFVTALRGEADIRNAPEGSSNRREEAVARKILPNPIRTALDSKGRCWHLGQAFIGRTLAPKAAEGVEMDWNPASSAQGQSKLMEVSHGSTMTFDEATPFALYWLRQWAYQHFKQFFFGSQLCSPT